MKWYQKIVKRILNGIILFLLPIVLLLFLMEKAIELVQKIIAPIKNQLPAEHFLGIGMFTIVCVVVILLACYIAGILAERSGMKTLIAKIEDHVLVLIPGYSIMKSNASEVLGENDDKWQAVLVGDDIDRKIGIQVDHQPDGYCIVFFPEPPDAKSGEIKFIHESKLRKSSMPVSHLIKIIRKYGHGAAALMNEKL